MATSPTSAAEARAIRVRTQRQNLVVELEDGRTLSVPLDWFPRLAAGTTRERGNWRMIGDGVGVHWPDLDEDISVRHLLEGRGSNESKQSLTRWLKSRKTRKAQA
jgi:hypothetical protein